MDAMTTTVTTEKRCPVCGELYRVLDEQGDPLPRELRQWDTVAAARYRDGWRWRDRCRRCRLRQTAELAARRRASRAAAAGARGLLTAPQAARTAGVSVATIVRAKKRGALPRELTPATVEAWARARRGED